MGYKKSHKNLPKKVATKAEDMMMCPVCGAYSHGLVFPDPKTLEEKQTVFCSSCKINLSPWIKDAITRGIHDSVTKSFDKEGIKYKKSEEVTVERPIDPKVAKFVFDKLCKLNIPDDVLLDLPDEA